jgi:anaerobic dimethyl sulfoxide reductase subunit C
MNRHKSLVAFTLLIQSAVAGIWCVGIALLLGDTPLGYGWHAFLALLLVLAGLSFSLGHLGRPGVCFYAVRNLRYSWLSREIAASVTLAAAVAAIAFTGLWLGRLNGWVVLAASAVGILDLYAMARAYRLRTVPSWNRASTFLSFLGSALLLGGLQFALVSIVPAVTSVAGCQVAELCLSRYVGLLVALIGLVVKVGAQSTNYSRTARSRMFVSFSRPVLQSGGVVLWVASMLLEDSAGPQWILLLLAAGFLVVGEIIHRSRFYGSYRSAGL